MSSLKTSVAAAVVSVALTAACFHHLHSKKAREAEFLRDQNIELLYRAYEADRAHHVQQAEKNPGGESAGHRSGTSMPPPSPRLSENYRNEGQGTPLAALQTLAWACDRGDVGTLTNLILIQPSARAKIGDYLSATPATAQARWKSPDEFAATQLAFSGMVSPFPNAEVLEAARFETISDRQAEFRLPETRRDHTLFEKADEQWKVVITEAMVDHFIKSLEEMDSAKPSAPQ